MIEEQVQYELHVRGKNVAELDGGGSLTKQLQVILDAEATAQKHPLDWVLDMTPEQKDQELAVCINSVRELKESFYEYELDDTLAWDNGVISRLIHTDFRLQRIQDKHTSKETLVTSKKHEVLTQWINQMFTQYNEKRPQALAENTPKQTDLPRPCHTLQSPNTCCSSEFRAEQTTHPHPSTQEENDKRENEGPFDMYFDELGLDNVHEPNRNRCGFLQKSVTFEADRSIAKHIGAIRHDQLGEKEELRQYSTIVRQSYNTPFITDMDFWLASGTNSNWSEEENSSSVVTWNEPHRPGYVPPSEIKLKVIKRKRVRKKKKKTEAVLDAPIGGARILPVIVNRSVAALIRRKQTAAAMQSRHEARYAVFVDAPGIEMWQSVSESNTHTVVIRSLTKGMPKHNDSSGVLDNAVVDWNSVPRMPTRRSPHNIVLGKKRNRDSRKHDLIHDENAPSEKISTEERRVRMHKAVAEQERVSSIKTRTTKRATLRKCKHDDVVYKTTTRQSLVGHPCAQKLALLRQMGIFKGLAMNFTDRCVTNQDMKVMGNYHARPLTSQ